MSKNPLVIRLQGYTHMMEHDVKMLPTLKGGAAAIAQCMESVILDLEGKSYDMGRAIAALDKLFEAYTSLHTAFVLAK